MRRALLSSWLLFGLACASFPEAPSPVAVDRSAPKNAATGESVLVEEFTLATVATQYPGPAEWLGVEVAQEIAEQLRHHGVEARAALPGEIPDATLVVRGEVIKAHGGSQAARAWAPGAGAAHFRVQGRALRPDGRVVGEFSRERRSSRSTDYLMVMEYCVEAVAADVAQMIIDGRYTTGP